MRQSKEQVPGAPVLIAEVGIPFNMQQGRAYRTGDFSMQARAMDASMQALERNLANHAIWNYTADNTNERGDQWNGEDFSLYSPDQERAGSDRAVAAVVRPWPRRVAGQPLEIGFDLRTRRFRLRFRHDPTARGATEVFVPRRHYPRGPAVEVSDGEWDWLPGEQLLLYRHTNRLAEHRLILRPRPG